MTTSDFEWMREQYFIGLRRQSWMILDNVGIETDIKKLDSYPILREAESNLYGYGRGRVYRFWCKRLRKYLAPGNQMALENNYRFYSKAVEIQLQLSFLEQGKRLGYIK